jgi:Family of unknown function (DUF6263)
MKRIYALTIAIPMAIGILSVSIFGQQNPELKLKLEKNRIYKFYSASEQTIVQTVNGNQQTIESKSNYSISIKMVDATSAFLVTEVHIDTIASLSNSMGKLSNMSSANTGDIKSKETSEIMSYIMNKMTKSPIYAKIDFTGKVIEIINQKMLSDMILKDTSLITLSGMMASTIITQIKNMVSESSCRTIIELFTYYLPGKSVSTGDSWTLNSATNAGGMALDISTRNQLEKLSGNNASITAESKIKAAANAAPMEAGGGKINYDDINGLSKSEIVIDLQTGLIVQSSSKGHVTGNLGFSMPGVSLQIPIDINSNSKVSSIK